MGSIEVRGPDGAGVAVLTLDRPEKRNALSVAVREAMSDALDRLAEDAEVRVVVLDANGPTFCAGFDLGEFDRAFAGDEAFAATLWASSDRWHHRLLSFPLPLVAAVNGPALGGGCDLATMCDLRIAADTAVFAHPEHAFSQVVYGPLEAAVGAAVANDLALTGRRVDASEALRLGLVSRVVPADELAAVASEVATEIAAAPRDTLCLMKAKIIRRARLVTGSSSAPTLDL